MKPLKQTSKLIILAIIPSLGQAMWIGLSPLEQAWMDETPIPGGTVLVNNYIHTTDGDCILLEGGALKNTSCSESSISFVCYKRMGMSDDINQQ